MKIDRSNPLSVGLVAAFRPGISNKDIAGIFHLDDGTPGLGTTVGSPYGLAWEGNGTTEYMNSVGETPIKDAIDCSYLAIAKPATSTTFGIIVSSVENIGSSAAVFELYTDNDGFIKSYCKRRTSGPSSPLTGPAYAAEWFTVVSTMKGQTDHRLYYNDSPVSTLSNDVGATEDLLANFSIGCWRDSDPESEFFAGKIALVLAWDRALEESEVKAAMANPWQVFKGKKGFVPIDTKKPDLAVIEVPNTRKPL